MAKENDKKRTKRPNSPLRELLRKKPKRVANGFGLFLRNYWSQAGNNPAKRSQNGMKAAAAEWKKMSDKRRASYLRQSEKDQKRYNKEMTAWKAERKFLTRPAGVYALFVKDTWQREKTSGRSIGEMGKYCSKQWAAMSSKGKQCYQERFERSQRRYAASLQDYEQNLLGPNDFNRKLDASEEYESVQAPEDDDDTDDEEGLFGDYDDEYE